MQPSKSLDHFTARPKSSFVLAALLVVLGCVAISGLVPRSVNRFYFAGHEWLLASACWGMAVFFAYCGIIGRRQPMSSKQNRPS
jgi:hypothetical protein